MLGMVNEVKRDFISSRTKEGLNGKNKVAIANILVVLPNCFLSC